MAVDSVRWKSPWVRAGTRDVRDRLWKGHHALLARRQVDGAHFEGQFFSVSAT